VKRSPLARSTKPMKRSRLARARKPIRSVSAKRKASFRARAECRRIVMERCGRACEACPKVEPGGLLRVAVHVHEILPRSAGGDITDPANCLGVCERHHQWIHEHPIEARQLGLLQTSWEAA
jgi:hypothetical protein